MRVHVGPLESLPTDRCVAVADGAAVAVRVAEDPAAEEGGGVVAFPNRCLHRDSELAGGRVRGGVLSCPQHFWQYRLPDGTHLGGRGCLRPLPAEVVDGEAFVEVPDPEPVLTMREQMLAHAREWERDR